MEIQEENVQLKDIQLNQVKLDDIQIKDIQISEINLKEISLEDKKAINAIREKYGHKTSSHAFQSLYIWKDDMKLQLYLEEDMFAVKTNLENDNEWFFPCGNPDRIKWFLEELECDGLVLRYMRQEDVDFLNENFPEMYDVEEYPGDDEYLYSVAEQIELKGKKLRTVRNHISRVQRDHELRYEAFNEENIEAVMKVCDAWERKSTEVCSLQDMTASDYLLQYRKELEVFQQAIDDGNADTLVAGFARAAQARRKLGQGARLRGQGK